LVNIAFRAYRCMQVCVILYASMRKNASLLYASMRNFVCKYANSLSESQAIRFV